MEQKMGGHVAQSCWLLLALSVKVILAGDWSVRVPSGPICAVVGSSVILPCSYDYPQSSRETSGGGLLSAQDGGGEDGPPQHKVLSEMWCVGDSRCLTPRYVYHSAGILLDPSYQNRVEFLGRAGTKNCSLKISNLRPSDSGNYVFYLITSHPTQKMPEQRGTPLLVADYSSAVTVSASPSGGLAEGMSLRLSCCSPSSGPRTTFAWFKSDSGAPKHNGQVWDVGNVTSAASGGYYCQMQTGDAVQNSTALDVDVEYPPRDTAVSVLPPGELPATLTCGSDANPPVRAYAWYRGAECLSTLDRSLHRARESPAVPAAGGATLSSGNLSAAEYGQHCCVARNRHGSQVLAVTLTDPRATTPSNSTGFRAVLIGVTACVLLAIIAMVAYLISRRRSSQHRSYALAATTASEP